MTWRWASASCRGTSHIRAGTKCQDASRTLLAGPDKSILILIASDGAGSAPFGGQGAAMVCRGLARLARAHFATSATLPNEEAARGWLDEIRDEIEAAGSARGASMRDFAATLVAAIIGDPGGVILHVGDGAAIVRECGVWRAASWPENGEYASTTYFVTDETGPRLRITPLESSPDAIAVFTDGIERLVLDLAKQEPHSPFFENMIRPVAAAGGSGRNAPLSRSLATYLNADAVNTRTDDDKTLILAART